MGARSEEKKRNLLPKRRAPDKSADNWICMEMKQMICWRAPCHLSE
jgi:hypothetical protein